MTEKKLKAGKPELEIPPKALARVNLSGPNTESIMLRKIIADLLVLVRSMANRNIEDDVRMAELTLGYTPAEVCLMFDKEVMCRMPVGSGKP